jgi:D-lyxose ketol-isomerase
MKKSIKNWLEIVNAIKEISKISLPVTASFRLAKLVSELGTSLDIFEKQRNELVKKYGIEKEDQKGTFVVSQENMSKFIEEINSLIQEQIEVQFTPIPLSILNDSKLPIESLSICMDLFQE